MGGGRAPFTQTVQRSDIRNLMRYTDYTQDSTQDSLNQTYASFGPEPENPPL